MTLKTTKLRDAITFALVAGATTVAGSGVAFAQDSDAPQATSLDRVQVTGSRIKRAEIEGPQPIVTINQEQMRASGAVSVGDVLRDSGVNSFGSFQGGSGFGDAQGAQEISLRGIGSQYTLVLVNGRRMSSSPALGGDAANVANIPMTAIERIEILRDGASAIYGSDAIGGVINIILKQNFEGMVVGGQMSRPTAAGGDDSMFYATMGIASDRGSMMLNYEKYDRAIILAADRPGLTGPADLSTPAGVEEAASLGLLSPTGFPGRYRRRGADGIAFGPWEAGPGCPDTFGSSTEFPRSARTPASWFGLSGGGDICAYNYAAVAGSTSALRRDTLTINGEYQITDNTSAFITAVSGRSHSFGRFAPTPSTLVTVVPADAPYNPTLGEVGPGLGYELGVNIRFDPLGPRDQDVYDYVSDIQTGLRGFNDNLFGGLDWEVAIGRSRTKMDAIGYNYVIAPLLQRAVNAGLNPFDLEAVAAAASTFAHTIVNDNLYRDQFVDARVGWDLFDIGGRSAGFVIGAEYHDISYKSVADQQSRTGLVVGTAGGSATGERTFSALYFETLLPVLETLEVGLAGRYDDYSDFGSKFTPKVSLAWRPNDTLLARANWGKGFKAPNMDQLYQSPAQSFLAARDRLACESAGIDPFSNDCPNVQRETVNPSNRNLDAETSTQWTIGGVWSPTAEFSVAVDYYNIKIDNQIRRVQTQEVVDAEYRCVNGQTVFCDAENWGSVDRVSRPGEILVTRPLANTASLETTGIDLTVRYNLDTGFGGFRTELAYGRVLDFKREAVPGAGLYDIMETYGIPENRLDLRVGWSLGDFSADVVGRYVSGWNNCLPQTSADDTPATLCDSDETIPSFTTWNVAASYEAPWNAKFTIGVRNIADRQTILQANGELDPLHEPGLYGRTPYVSYEQRF